MMKILISHYGIKEKGGWGRTFLLARGLAKIGHDVTLITNNNSSSNFFVKKTTKDNVKIISFPDILPLSVTRKGYGLLSLILKLIYVSFNRFDIVQSDTGHRPSSGFPCLLNKYIYKSVYISEWWDFYGEGGFYNQKSKFFKLLLGRYEKWAEINNKIKADGVVVLSEFMYNRALSLNIKSEKLTIVHGGALTDIINFHPLKAEDSGPVKFGYIGMSDDEIDDLEPFLIALRNVSEKADVKFVTYGYYVSKQIVDRFDLEHLLVEKGWLNYFNSPDDLSDVDVFILIKKDNTGNLAGWPNKLGDYFAAGRAVLVTPYGDVAGFVSKFPDGFFCVSRDIKELEETIINIINKREVLKEMGMKNRVIAEQYLSWESKARELEQFYCKLK